MDRCSWCLLQDGKADLAPCCPCKRGADADATTHSVAWPSQQWHVNGAPRLRDCAGDGAQQAMLELPYIGDGQAASRIAVAVSRKAHDLHLRSKNLWSGAPPIVSPKSEELSHDSSVVSLPLALVSYSLEPAIAGPLLKESARG